MGKETEEKVNRTLDLIKNDRVRPDDPFFTTRLMARAEREFAVNGREHRHSSLYLKMRPVFAVAAVALGIFAGIFLGTRLGRVNPGDQTVTRSALFEQYSQENYLTEINGSIEEHFLSK
jgi:hypothetical protein